MISEKRNLALTALLIAGIILCFPAAGLTAQRYTEANVQVDNSLGTFRQFSSDQNMRGFQEQAKRARGIMIFPQVLRGGFFIGGAGGTGVLLARDMKTGHWHGPAFYTMGSVTFGVQIGAEASQVVMFIMTQKGLNSFLSSSFKLGADVTIAAGPVGAGAKAATADILSYARAKGAYGGFTIEGAVMNIRDGWNTSYYGGPAPPVDILINGTAKNAYGDELIKAITDFAAPTTRQVTY